MVPLLQLVLAAVALLGMYGVLEGAWLLPRPTRSGDAVAAFADAVATAQDLLRAGAAQCAPSLAPLLVGAADSGALIVMDLIAGGLGRVPASGLVLLMVYTLPVTVWVQQHLVCWSSGFLLAVSCLMLFLREDERFSQWGRQITGWFRPRATPPGSAYAPAPLALMRPRSAGWPPSPRSWRLGSPSPPSTWSVFGFGVGPGRAQGTLSRSSTR